MSDSLDHAQKARITFDEWVLRVKQPGYRYLGSEWYKAGKALEAEAHPKPTPPVHDQASPFGTAITAGALRGRGIMLGGNPDVWDQAITLAKDEYVDVVAITPGTPSGIFPCRVTTWIPPEREPHAGDIHQAENANEWKKAAASSPMGIALNSWEYGHFPAGTVALVESYYNEGWGLNFEEFRNYMPQGAAAVIPLCGGYSAAGRSDAESARIYESLATWPGGSFPGFWMYAGEDLLTAESVEVLKAWKP